MKSNQFKIFFFLMNFLIVSVFPLFAANLVPSGLESLGDSVMEVFTGGLVKTIMIVCLAGCAVAYGFNKDNEKMKRNIIAIGIAIAIIVGAQWIVGAIWSASMS